MSSVVSVLLLHFAFWRVHKCDYYYCYCYYKWIEKMPQQQNVRP